jgi:hypothetical protein
MTFEEFKVINERRARLHIQKKALEMRNEPLKLEEQIKSDAQFRLAHDLWMKAERDYRDALCNFTVEELEELAKGGENGV